MANDLLKAVVKLSTAVAGFAFGAKVGKEGKANYDNWKKVQQNVNKK